MKTCKVDNCDNKHKGYGYCQMHLIRLKAHGDLELHYAKKHGGSHSSEYNSWLNMKQRCLNPHNNNYQNYGGRGITVFDEWKEDFMAFYNYIGKKPSSQHSIDRINNDGNYEPGNVRWATYGIQQGNKRPYTNTGYKYISINRWKTYTIKINSDINKKHIGSAKTLEQAIKMRDEYQAPAVIDAEIEKGE